MFASGPTTVVDETLAPGLRYTEEVGRTTRSHPVRYCYLWQEGEESPVSELEVHSLEQRFGAVAVAAEGIGGVETPPPFRRRGYLRQLLTRASAGMAQRVVVGFVSDAIDELYEKFGFYTSLANGHLSLKIRDLDRLLADTQLLADNRTIRTYTATDIPAMVELYNIAHANRPWTLVRPSDWNRLKAVQTWKPGSTAFVLMDGEELAGYVIYQEQFFGWPNQSWTVDEMTARDEGAARRLLMEAAQRCWQMRFSDFVIREPLDSLVGFAARQLGCEYHQSYRTTGGMMGAILHRAALLSGLEPELRRRLPVDDLVADHELAFQILQQGELIADDRVLLRLLLGDWSMKEAQAANVTVPPRFAALCAAWFPGGGTQALAMPFAHKLDRY